MRRLVRFEQLAVLVVKHHRRIRDIVRQASVFDVAVQGIAEQRADFYERAVNEGRTAIEIHPQCVLAVWIGLLVVSAGPSVIGNLDFQIQRKSFAEAAGPIVRPAIVVPVVVGLEIPLPHLLRIGQRTRRIR